ncbi:MAG: DUF1330 domain-containing protein [Rivularia sp. (in: cyanobacteria)]
MPEQSPVYAIGQFEVLNPEKYLKEYGIPLAPILESYGAEVLLATPELKIIEGSYEHNFTVIIKFPSDEVAHKFYQSSEYQPLKAKRMELTNSATSRFVIAPAFLGLPA